MGCTAAMAELLTTELLITTGGVRMTHMHTRHSTGTVCDVAVTVAELFLYELRTVAPYVCTTWKGAAFGGAAWSHCISASL